MLADAEERAAIEDMNRRRAAEEEGFGHRMEEEAEKKRLEQRKKERQFEDMLLSKAAWQPAKTSVMGMSQLQGYLQQLQNRPPRIDVERNKILERIHKDFPEAVKQLRLEWAN
jgi:hypothetical protein